MKKSHHDAALILIVAMAVMPARSQATSAPGSTQQACPLPEGWKVYPVPVPGSTDWVHGNHSDREWRVQAVGDKVVIKRISLNEAVRHTSGKVLPFKIKPRMGWVFTTAPSLPPPPPPPGSYEGKDSKAEDYRRPIRDASGWYRSFEQKFIGAQRPLRVSDGWIVGFDAGEWGGALYWFSPTGKSQYQIHTDRPTSQFDPENVQSLLPCKEGVLSVQGYAQFGKIEKITRQKDGKWKAALLTLLEDAPQVSLEDGEDKWLILTSERMVRLRADGTLQPLWRCESIGMLWPNSMAKDSDGVLYVGMRHFVARLVPDGEDYRVEFMVPTNLPLFDPDPADDAS